MKLELDWWKCDDGNQWCGLESVNLSKVTIGGVYVIWHSGQPRRWVYVGQADCISDRLLEHRQDPGILQYKQYGMLLTSWAAVQPEYRNGVERYLAEACNPLNGERWPSESLIEVNLPR